MSFIDSYIITRPSEIFIVIYVDYENGHITKKVFPILEDAKEYYDSLKRLFLDARRYEMSGPIENVVQYYRDSFFYSKKIGEISMATLKL